MTHSTRRVGIVDLGSNTARLVVYEYEPGTRYRLEDEIREPIRLGEGLGAHGKLSPAAIERALKALRLYHDYSVATELPPLEVIATSAVRDAADRSEFLEKVRHLNLEVEVLSGADEARLAVLAVANSFAVEDAWVMDLGGGSAQISRMTARRPVEPRSVPLGAVRLTEAHLESDPPKPKQVERLEEAVASELADVATRMQQDEAPWIAMGGTVRNLARTIQKEQGYTLDLLHNYFLRHEDFEGLVARLLTIPARKRAMVPGIHPDRADVILAGALVYRWLLRQSGRPGIWISGQGVREGAFYRHFLPEPHLLPDVRRFSIENVFRRYPQPEPHTRRVEKLSLRLFDELQPLHGYGPRERQLLEAAARLHDIGTVMNYYDHHKHGAYLVRAAPVPGWSHREQSLLALLVRYHRKGKPKKRGYKALLGKGDRKRLRVLSTCLRLAEKLERSRAGRVEDVEVEVGKKQATVRLLASEPPEVELWEAKKHARLFKKALKRKLRFRTTVLAEDAPA